MTKQRGRQFLIFISLLMWTTVTHSLTFIESKIDGVDNVDGLQGASSVAVAPDGKHVYATGFFDNAVSVFAREGGTGKLTFVEAITNTDIGGDGLSQANKIIVSPDNKHVYAVSAADNTLVLFNRDVSTGKLTVTSLLKDEVHGGSGLGGASDIAISPDRTRVYVTGALDNAISVFARDVNAGTLSFLGLHIDGHNQVTGLKGATSVAVSQDGAFIYVASTTDNAIVVFTRNPTVGELGYVATYRNNETITGLNGAYDLLVTPDNKQLYVVSNSDNSLVVFNRDIGTGQLSFVKVYKDGVDGIDGLAGVRAITMNPNGTEVYTASVSDSAITVFSRDTTTGELTFTQLLQNNTNGGQSLESVNDIAASADNQHVYAVALSSNSLNLFSATSTDMALSMSEVAIAEINSNLTYTLTVTNNGKSNADTVTVIDTLPPELTFGQATASQGSCAHNATDKTVTCQLGALANGATASITITAATPTVVPANKLTNTATVSSNQPDGNSSNNTINVLTEIKEAVAKADLSVAIAPIANPLNINSKLNYSVTLTNKGPDAATNVKLSTPLPTGVTFSSAPAGCVHENQTITCTIDSLAKDATIKLDSQVLTPATPTETITFTSSVAATELDTVPENNTLSVSSSVTAIEIDLAITEVLATPTSVNVGDEITFSVGVQNNLPATVTGVLLQSQLPPEVKYINEGCSVDVNNQLVCDLGMLDAVGNTSTTVELKVQALEAGQTGPTIQPIPVIFTATGNGTDAVNNHTGSTSVIITGEVADISITITDNGNPKSVNTPIVYTVNIMNNGPAAAPVTMAYEITGSSVIMNASNCGAGKAFSCEVPTLSPGETTNQTIEVTPNELGTVVLNATATLAGSFFDPTTPNKAKREVSVSDAVSDLGLTLEATPTTAFLGKNFTYTATIKNEGPNDATGVLLTQTIPQDVEFVEAKGSQGSPCVHSTPTEGEASSTPTNVSCEVGTVNSGEEATVVINLKPTKVGTLQTSAEVSSLIFDNVQANNLAELTNNVSQSSVDLSLNVLATPNPMLVDNRLSYTMNLRNYGPDLATGIQLSSTLPKGVSFMSATLSPSELGSCSFKEENLLFSCGVETLNARIINAETKADTGEEVSITLTVVPQTIGKVEQTFSVQSKEYDTNEDNNKITTTVQVSNPAALFFVEAKKLGDEGIQGLQGINDVIISPDGRHVYAVGFQDNSLTTFRRDPQTGQLTFVKTLFNGVEGVDGLKAASSVAITPDGSHVYAIGFEDNAIAVFNRDPTSGVLTFVETHKNGLNDITGLSGAYGVAATNNHIYVASAYDDSITVFSRELSTGKLTFVTSHKASDGIQGLSGASAVTVTPDGLHVIVAAPKGDSLAVFNRDFTTGKLAFIQTITNDTALGVQGLDSVDDVVVSGDGRHVYAVAAGTDNAITVFSRNPANGLLTFVQILRDGLNSVDGLNGAYGVTISPLGDFVYAAGINDNAVAIFARDVNSGQLDFVEAIKEGDSGIDGLGGARAVAVDPTGAHVYVAGFVDNAIAVLRVSTADLDVTIEDNADPINVGDDLIYALTVTNKGPDQATNVTLINTLPAEVSFVSFTPSQGTCQVTDRIVTCPLGVLENGGTATVTLVTTAINMGNLTNTATVTANQLDLNAPNTVAETTEVIAIADLVIAMEANPSPAVLGNPYDYQVTVTNQGPHAAPQVNMQLTLPTTVTFQQAVVSEALEGETCTFTAPVITCALSDLTVGTPRHIITTVIPSQEGTLTAKATVVSGATDPTLPNEVTTSTSILLNVINDQRGNQGQTLSNYIIDTSGSVIGGTLAGAIINRGYIENVTIAEGAIVRGEQLGELSGTIVNQGIIDTAELSPGTVIQGGIVRGKISGFPSDPARITATIEAGTELENVIIEATSEVDPGVIIGANVLFAANRTIPAGIKLTQAFPTLTEPMTQLKSMNLRYDVLVDGGDLLSEINALPDLSDNQLAFVQSAETGQLLLRLPNGEDIVILPLNVYQATADQTAGISVDANGSAVFVTASGRVVYTQPTLQNPQVFKAILDSLGISGFTAREDGNLIVPVNDRYYIAVRPDKSTYTSEYTVQRLVDAPSPLIANLDTYFVTYEGFEGEPLRQQMLYAAPANQTELKTILTGIPSIRNLTFHGNGTVSGRVGARTYTAVYDYQIYTGKATNVTNVEIVEDQNADGKTDLRITYQNGDQQLLYIVPLPNVTDDVQSIPEIQSLGYHVSQNSEGHLILERNGERMTLAITAFEELDEDTPVSMTSHSDGSITFVTTKARYLETQPLVQGMQALENALRFSGIQPEQITQEENGNLTITVDAQTQFIVRPSLTATQVSNVQALGVQQRATGLANVIDYVLTFDDTTSVRYQQYLYPAAKEPDVLQQFLLGLPNVQSVDLHNDGRLIIRTNTTTMQGKLAYNVQTGGTATGSLQLLQEGQDYNADGREDFLIVYGNGERQVIYQE